MFVESQHRRKVRHNIPQVDDAIADVDERVEEPDIIGITDARVGPRVHDGRDTSGDIVQQVRGRDSLPRLPLRRVKSRVESSYSV